MSIQSFIKDIVIGVIEDERTQVVAEKLVGQVIVKYVTPLIAPTVAAAIDQAFDHLTDLNRDGKPDVQQIVDAGKSIIDQFLPPWLRIPGITS